MALLLPNRSRSQAEAVLQPYTFLYNSSTPLAISRKWANVRIHELGPQYRDFVWRESWER